MKTFFNSHEEDDSTWKIVYMDMITMLMILFLSMWIIDRGKPEDKRKHGDVTLNKVEFEADDYFDPGKADLKSQARSKMEEIFFNRAHAFPVPGPDVENGGRRVVLIHGHTDDQGEKEKNLQLGFDRAMAVYRELNSRLPSLASNVGICSYADNFPAHRVKSEPAGASPQWLEKIRTDNRKRRKQNRRFEIVGQFEESDDYSGGR